MNDPNGLVHTAAGYHAFFQYNPSDTVWGDIVWGHAVSEDLLHWRQLGVAIDPGDVMAFSGSAVPCDAEVLGSEGGPLLVAAYTGHHADSELQEQRLAVSRDDGLSWQPLGDEPVLGERSPHFRDPCLFWHSASEAWVMMVVYASRHQVAFFRSPDLRTWTRHGIFQMDEAEDVEWECPELVRLADPQHPGRDLWMLKVDLSKGAVAGGSGGKYFLGNFDGFAFEALPVVDGPPEAEGLWAWLDYGKDFYAAQTFSRSTFGKSPLWLGWASNWQYARQTPTETWRGCLSLPRHLSLGTGKRGCYLRQTPIPLNAVATGPPQALPQRIEACAPRVTVPSGRCFELRCRFTRWTAREIGLDLAVGRGCRSRLVFQLDSERLIFDRRMSGETAFHGEFPVLMEAPFAPRRGFDLHVVVDHSVVEVFVDNGRLTMTHLIFPPDGAEGFRFFTHGGDAVMEDAQWTSLETPKG